MSRTTGRSENVIARRCKEALQLAADPNRLTNAPCEQLGVAAAFLARALGRVEDGSAMGGADATRQLEAAGKIIGAELRRRSLLDRGGQDIGA